MSAHINMMVCIGRGFGAFGHNKVTSASKYDGVYVSHGFGACGNIMKTSLFSLIVVNYIVQGNFEIGMYNGKQ